MTASTFGNDAVPLRVLLAVHGYEVPGWAHEAGRVASRWMAAHVRVLALLDVPSPPLTSGTPVARRMVDAARAGWIAIERERLRHATAALLPELRAGVDVVFVPAMHGGLARTIVRCA